MKFGRRKLMEHCSEKFSEYLNGELSQAEARTVEAHLSACETCRAAFEEMSFGHRLAGSLAAAEAPENLWTRIEQRLDENASAGLGLIPRSPFWTLRFTVAFAASIITVSALAALVYLGLFSGDSPYQARSHAPSAASDLPLPPAAGSPLPAVSPPTNSNTAAAETPAPTSEKLGWRVETIAGKPRIGDEAAAAKIDVGELLETDAASSARIAVADIGTVEISPNSRVKFIGSRSDEHRLSLEKGRLHAKIFAPPRIFVVDTPSGKAVDLGCEYTLEVDAKGDSILNVTSGFVALERSGRESIVPAGMMCRMRKSKGVGTPFSSEATAKFRDALERFDFSGGGSSSLAELLAEADLYDIVTLWHLLSRVARADRGKVFDELSKFVEPPSGVTRDGIIALDKKMLEAWRDHVETAWFSAA